MSSLNVHLDLVLKLREIRRMKGMTQKYVAKQSGVGEKTISTFETGIRIESLKVAQLRAILRVYGMTEADFFGSSVERLVVEETLTEKEREELEFVRRLNQLPDAIRDSLLGTFRVMAIAAGLEVA